MEAKAKATTPARASRKDVDKGKTRVKVDEEEALTASQTRTTRIRTRTEATPTLIQGGTPSPLEGSLVRPHAHKRRSKLFPLRKLRGAWPEGSGPACGKGTEGRYPFCASWRYGGVGAGALPLGSMRYEHDSEDNEDEDKVSA